MRPVLEGRYVTLRNLDWEDLGENGTPRDLLALNRIYSQPENEWRFLKGRTPTPMRMFATVEDPEIENQKLVIIDGDVVGHIVASHADYRSGEVRVSVIRAPGRIRAVEAIPLFIDLLFDVEPFRVIEVIGPEYNVAQFEGLLARRVLGERVYDPERYWLNDRWWGRVKYAIWRDSWWASGLARGGYLNVSDQKVG